MISPKKITFSQLLLLFICGFQLVDSSRVSDLLQQFLDETIEALAPSSLIEGPVTFADPPKCQDKLVEIKCNDCKSQLVCDGTSTGSVLQCPDQYPYCDPDGVSCSETPSANCTETPKEPDSLRCSGSGYFPAPDNCSKYFVCDGMGASPYAYQCPAKMVYDPNLGRCKTKRLSRDCSIFKCDLRTRNPIIVHPVYPQYFGLCNTYNTTLQTAVAVLKCPTNYILNKSSYACDFKCPRAGYYLGSERNKFVLCYKAGARMKYIEETCPPGYNFDDTTSNCVKF